MDIEKIEFGAEPNFTTYERLSLLNELLTSNICRVKFMKVDGTEREFVCTLMKEHLPVKDESTVQGKIVEKKTSAVMFVFLPQENVWRSFRVDNVISIEVASEA